MGHHFVARSRSAPAADDPPASLHTGPSNLPTPCAPARACTQTHLYPVASRNRPVSGSGLSTCQARLVGGQLARGWVKDNPLDGFALGQTAGRVPEVSICVD